MKLLHLNGPPGIGKSTIAQRYADDHPGVLNLDIDRLRPLVGGWRDRFSETNRIIRPLALSMARTHLAAGLDVVMPQYIGVASELAKFEAAARENGAVFHEIVLMDTKQRALRRFADRDDTPWDRAARDAIDQDGLARAYDRLTALVTGRPHATVIHTSTVEQTYQALLTTVRAAAS